MTLEEAMKRLKEARFTVQPYQYINEALDMAIKALEQEPCDKYIKEIDHLHKYISKLETQIVMQEPCEDAISRQAVIDDLEKSHMTSGVHNQGTWNECVDSMIHTVRSMPSVNPQKAGWIPVSERLPEDNELVLFSTKTDRVFEGRFFYDNTNRQWYSFCDRTFAWNNVVIAWMPLPEPYKAESEE